jgi:SynChlorMet cassette radical SAM/SPASM protein ScmE
MIWDMIDGTCEARELVNRMSRAFELETDSDPASDLIEYTQTLRDDGFLLDGPKTDTTQSVTSDTCISVREAPYNFDLSLTGKCNLNCDYCFYADAMAGKKDLPAGEWFQFFRELRKIGARSLTLSGGEVFTRDDLWELIDAIVDSRLRFSFLSNGTLIDEQVIGQLHKSGRRCRLDYIQISIDGSCAEVHDGIRGRGSFENSVRAMRLLREAGIPLACRSTINANNVDDIENIAAFLLEDIGLFSFSTNDAMPMGAGCSNQPTIGLTPRQQLQAMRAFEKLETRYPGRVTATAGPAAKVKAFRDMERARLTGKKQAAWRMGFLSACGGVFKKLAVNHDGVITPCNTLFSTDLGIINQNPIISIWRTHPHLEALRNRRNVPMKAVPGCEGCEWVEFCNGSCPGLACEMTGDFNRGNPHDCYRRFLKQISEEEREEMFIEPVLKENETWP